MQQFFLAVLAKLKQIAVWAESFVKDVVSVFHSFIQDLSSHRNRVVYGSIIGLVIFIKVASVWWLQLAGLAGIVAIVYIDRKFYAVERPTQQP